MSRRRILFVDDEPNVIDGLRRMLRRQRMEWEMEFVPSAPAALAKMAACPFDVVVTDLQMPEMSGAELLERVQTHYPGTARIVLSGHADETLTRRAMRWTHRFLAKPVEADKLVATVAEACSAQMILPDERLRALVGGCEKLPSAPTLYMELTRAIEAESSDAHSIAEIIGRDMAMSAKLLQLVNSSFFGLGQRVSSVERTVAMLGVIRIKALVLSDHIFSLFKPQRALTELSLEQLWQHSLSIAELARDITRAEHQGGDRPDQAFMAGLLHDIGLLILASRQGEAVEEICRAARKGGSAPCALEKERWGVNHADVGAFLLRLWGLPPRIVEAVQEHHTPANVSYNGLCALSAVHAADALEGEVLRAQKPPGDDLYATALDSAYLERAGLAARLSAWRELVQAAHARRRERAS